MVEIIFLVIYGLGVGAFLMHIIKNYEPNILATLLLIIISYPIGFIMAHLIKSLFNFIIKKKEV